MKEDQDFLTDIKSSKALLDIAIEDAARMTPSKFAQTQNISEECARTFYATYKGMIEAMTRYR